ncbi:cytochrome P450 4e2-like [Eurosta solidaginis]|uniref:cytochrome P450 4e2-like n=1 Tax=Eurosta solidaginis TaxID=178769 RepID=UPI00353154B8
MWFLLWFILSAPFIFLLYIEIKNFRALKLVNKFPGPPSLPIIGNAHLMETTPRTVFNQLFQWWIEYGRRNYRVLIGPFQNIMITEAKDVEFILNSKELIDKSDIYDMLRPWLGDGLVTTTGRKWYTHRKMITPSFHFKILQNFYEIMNKCSDKFMEKLTEASQGDSIFDFQSMTQYLTLDVITDTAMGVQINAMDNTEDKIVTAFKEMCSNINMRIYNPWKRSNFFYRFSPDYPQFQRTLKLIEDFTNDVIAKRIAKRKQEGNQDLIKEEDDISSKRKLAFLDTLLSATIDGRPLTQHEIYDEVSTFIFEGHDTTNSGICFTIYLLSIFPEIQKKVYAEQLNILGDNIKGKPTYQQISEMQYLDMVIKENLRIYPSVPMIARCADKDYNMNGYVVPKGASLNIFLMTLGYNEKYFSDPHRMYPERWSSDKRTKQNPFEYVPFSAGLRNCIGQKYALLEMKAVVSKMVRTFEILPPLDELVSKDGCIPHLMNLPAEEQKRRSPNPSKYVPKLEAVLTLKSENGIWLRLRKRN